MCEYCPVLMKPFLLVQEDLSAQLRTMKKRLKDAEEEQYRVCTFIFCVFTSLYPFLCAYMLLYAG